MRAFGTVVLAALFAFPLAAAPPPAPAKSPPAKQGAAKQAADDKPFAESEHSAEGLRFHKEPHAVKHHTRHGAWHKKPPVKHQPLSPSHFRKHAPNGGLVTLPHGKKVSPADWQAVLDLARTRTATPDGAKRAQFADDIDLGRLAQLVAAEQHCCAFFSFAITIDDRGIALEVRAPDGAADIVSSLFG